MKTGQLTRFIARRVRGVSIDCLCFGVPFSRHDGRSGTVYRFQAGQLFAIMKWRRFGDDRQHRSLLILEAAQGGALGHDVGGIRPSPIVHAMVDQHGPAGQGGAVDRLLDWIQELQAYGVAPDRIGAGYWRDAAIRVMLCEPRVEASVGDVAQEGT